MAQDKYKNLGRHIQLKIDKGELNNGEVFFYILPTIIIQPLGKNYQRYGKVYVSWLNFHIIFGGIEEG